MLIILYKLYQDSAFPEMINSILVATYQEQSCLLRRLKSQIARGASHHQVSWKTACLLVIRVSLMYLVDEFFLL